MAKKKKEQVVVEGAPAWMATYSDLVTLLMCFFVLLFAFSTIDNKKFQQVMNSFKGGAGVMEAGTSVVEDEKIFDGMPEVVNSSAAGDETYRAVMIKVKMDKVKEGEVITATATATDGISKNPQDYDWQSSNSEVASVDSDGKIKIYSKDDSVVIYAKHKETGVVAAYHINSDLQNTEIPDISNASEWAEEFLKDALDKDLMPESLKGMDLQIEINREEFVGICLKVYESLSGEQVELPEENPFIDTNDPDVLKAYKVGITAGTEKNRFSPSSPLNREQAATLLTRVYKKLNFEDWTLEKDMEYELDYSGAVPFKDDADISPWAKPSVYFMVKNGIISGVGNNMFAPKSYSSEETAMTYADLTREQALVMGLRMVESLRGNE